MWWERNHPWEEDPTLPPPQISPGFPCWLSGAAVQVRIEEASGWDTTCKPLSMSCLALNPCVNVSFNARGSAGSPVCREMGRLWR